MSTPNFEESVLESLSGYIQQYHKDLTVSFHHSGTMWVGESVIPSTDLVISNASGRMLGIELKDYRNTVPFGVYPQLKNWHEAFKAASGAFVAITPSGVPEALRSNISNSGINIIQFNTPSELYPKLEPVLQMLEQKNGEPSLSKSRETA